MVTAIEILKILTGIIGVGLSFSLIFQLVVSFFGFKKTTRDYETHDPEMRFLVLIPAHNEEAVIPAIIENMQQMDYPKELYDFYVLADNCTDRTAELSRSLGANVLEFHNQSKDEPTGKTVALKKAFLALEGYQEKYDAVFFFDADNLVDKTMFREVNSQFLSSSSNTEVIQCYLDCKNKTGIIAYFYYLTYVASNRFLQYARCRIGLNTFICGTGFAVRTRYLYQRGGWTTESLTEDVELQFDATLEGRKVLWNNNVRVYDEKPTTLKASLRQRIRWAQGHWYIFFRNLGPLFKRLFTGKIPLGEFFSMLVQMLFPATFLFSFINGVLVAVQTVLSYLATKAIPNYPTADFNLVSSLISLALLVYTLMVQWYWSDWVDNRIKPSIRALPYALLCTALNTPVVILAQFIGLLKCRQQTVWVKTEHKINLSREAASQITAPSLSSENKEGV